ncbi:TetR/AcrR family transcriptional regulator [Niallia sp.]|uniref:TetR/AcrR family transcriptional regulator n=1 Tax=Niallia sp. TaxID=2837523 RepID=UPI002896BCD2|nr:TetR/AcrR family transcriptional regulator [Niallia sp.]
MTPKVSQKHLEQRRANILKAAKNVFIEHGYEKTTMRHVMEEADVSRGGLYQYFSNKEDIFEAILAENLSSEVINLEQLLHTEIESYWQLLLSYILDENPASENEINPLAPSILEFFVTGRNDIRRREYAKKRYELALKLYEEIIKAGQNKGEFSQTYNSKTIAQSIITFTDGLALDYAILPPKEVNLKEQSTLFVEYLKMLLK